MGLILFLIFSGVVLVRILSIFDVLLFFVVGFFSCQLGKEWKNASISRLRNTYCNNKEIKTNETFTAARRLVSSYYCFHFWLLRYGILSYLTIDK